MRHVLPPAHTGGEDGTVRVWDLRSPGCQREYGSRAAVNTVVLHPNQGELISGGWVGGLVGGNTLQPAACPQPGLCTTRSPLGAAAVTHVSAGCYAE